MTSMGVSYKVLWEHRKDHMLEALPKTYKDLPNLVKPNYFGDHFYPGDEHSMNKTLADTIRNQKTLPKDSNKDKKPRKRPYDRPYDRPSERGDDRQQVFPKGGRGTSNHPGRASSPRYQPRNQGRSDNPRDRKSDPKFPNSRRGDHNYHRKRF